VIGVLQSIYFFFKKKKKKMQNLQVERKPFHDTLLSQKTQPNKSAQKQHYPDRVSSKTAQ